MSAKRDLLRRLNEPDFPSVNSFSTSDDRLR